ncbi:nodulation protein NodH [Roseobacter sp. HKCCA0434]|uniref:nodulation protein NodH n=1 Tax=Roseobacter sp. HKCCA0434 TaxID=3079297 RepID=UPI002905CC38|nr:nodulation protein NodH [Roseobacter sp. HKCCA0434]
MAAGRFRYFCVLGAMRTGSNLLQRTLDQFPDISCHGELFNPGFIDRRGVDEMFGVTRVERDAEPERLIDAMIAQAGDGVLPGFRLFEDHDLRVRARVIGDPRAAKIVLRRNPLDSFVSLKIAQQTDQWMLTRLRARKTAKIHFDLAEYREYVERLDRFHEKVCLDLRVGGQTAFTIAYDEVQNFDLINGLAAWLGVEGRLDEIAETLQRQNPGPLEEKVENYAQMVEQLRDSGSVVTGPTGSNARANGVRFLNIAAAAPVLYAAIPGGPNEAILDWLSQLSGHEETVTVPTNRKVLTDWQKAQPDHLCFTALRHPLLRAYSAFMDKIFGIGDDGFPHIRAYLVDHFGLMLPEADMTDREAMAAVGYDAQAHARAFLCFLTFLRANLAGRTPMRVDGLWAPQQDFVEGFSGTVTLSLILRDDDLLTGAAYIKRRFKLRQARNAVLRTPDPDHVFALSEIHQPEMDDLARAAYARDFMQFGFRDWAEYQAAREAIGSVRIE